MTKGPIREPTAIAIAASAGTAASHRSLTDKLAEVSDLGNGRVMGRGTARLPTSLRPSPDYGYANLAQIAAPPNPQKHDLRQGPGTTRRIEWPP